MREIVELASRVAELERRLANMIRPGTVKGVDPKAGTARLVLGQGEDGSDFLGPAIPYSQIAGALKGHIPPTDGQQMLAISPTGDPRQAVAIPLGFSDQNKSPSEKGDENVITFGSFTAELRGSELVVKVPRLLIETGGVTFELTGGGLKIAGGKVEHDGLNIGSDHKHRDVVPGGGLTGIPTA